MAGFLATFVKAPDIYDCKKIRYCFSSANVIRYAPILVAAELHKTHVSLFVIFLAFSLCFHVTVPQPTGKHESNELHKSNLMLNWKRSPFSQICHIRETHAIFANPLFFSAKWFSGISFLLGLVENQSLVD